MRALWLGMVVMLVVAGPAVAAVQEQTAKDKARVLEQLASPEGGGQPPAPAELLRPGQVQAVDPAGQEPLADAVTCLARTIYWEAKGEERAGMAAIASVVMNRLGHEGFPDRVCAVVKQGREKGECQFSWWCDGHPDQVEEEGRYAVAKEIAGQALNRQLPDSTGGALYFHQRTTTPDWAGKYVRTAEVGGHIFYKPRDGKAK